MFALRLTDEWVAWVAALAAPLHRRLAGRRAEVVVGIVRASGRRTAARGWRAAGLGARFRSSSSFLGSVGRTAIEVAAVLRRITLDRIDAGDRLVVARDDTPTKRSGPELPGAGLPPHPTPGPAGSKGRSGPRWVVLSRVARPEHHGAIGRPVLGPLDVRTKDVPTVSPTAGITLRTKSAWAAEAVTWLGSPLPSAGRTPGLVGEGGSAQREFLTPAKPAGVVVVARLRKEAALSDRPPTPPPGPKRGRGRPPIAAQNRLSLAKRAGPRRGGRTVAARRTQGGGVTKRSKTFLATWRPAGGVVRVVILEADDGSWRAFLGTEAQASVAAIVPTVLERWAIEPDFHDRTEVERIEPGQWRRVGSKVGALHLSLWVPTRTAVWGWSRPAEERSARTDSPWEDAERRPSQADRRKALPREMREEEYRRIGVPQPWSEKIRHLLAGVVRLAA